MRRNLCFNPPRSTQSPQSSLIYTCFAAFRFARQCLPLHNSANAREQDARPTAAQMVNAQPTPTARIKGPMAAVPPDAIRQRERFIEAVALKLWLLNRSTMRIARSCQIRTGRKS